CAFLSKAASVLSLSCKATHCSPGLIARAMRSLSESGCSSHAFQCEGGRMNEEIKAADSSRPTRSPTVKKPRPDNDGDGRAVDAAVFLAGSGVASNRASQVSGA